MSSADATFWQVLSRPRFNLLMGDNQPLIVVFCIFLNECPKLFEHLVRGTRHGLLADPLALAT